MTIFDGNVQGNHGTPALRLNEVVTLIVRREISARAQCPGLGCRCSGLSHSLVSVLVSDWLAGPHKLL